MKKKDGKRLLLAKETLLQLHDQRLSRVAGATGTCTMITCSTCYPGNCDPASRTCPP